MGCGSSKLDDLPAVALCRDRCTFLDEAIHQRYVLAEAHFAYMQSLKGIGVSLLRFFDHGDIHMMSSKAVPLSPVLPLPKERKGGDLKAAAAAAVASPEEPHHHLDSNSGGHLEFHSDSDSEDFSHGSLHHSGNSSPLHDSGFGHYQEYDMMNHNETLSGFPSGFMNMNYMKKQTTPSVTYQQRPMETVMHMGESSSSSSHYTPYPYPYSNPNPNPNPSPYPYNGFPNYGGNNGYYYGQQNPYGGGAFSPPPAGPRPGPGPEASSSKPPPPPPSPPTTSAWDFLNPFESYEKFYPDYTPSRNSKDVRDEEGIPDLEEEDYYQHEVVKEVHGRQKFVDGGVAAGNHSKSVAADEGVKKGGGGGDREALYEMRPSVSVENEAMEYEVHMVEKKVIDNEKSEERGNVGAFKGHGGFRGVSDVLREIQVQFERAAESGSELAKMLEVGKQPYQRKHAAYQVSSKMLHVRTPSLSVVSSQPSTSTNAESSSSAEKAGSLLEFDEDAGMRLKNLSATLQKLHLWEKKLYNEVKAEEKMRVAHERKCRKLKHLDERGAEAHKVDATRTLIRSLSTKIRISIQVVDKISVTINKIRDEELWPQINELIHGLTRMWKSMLECHHSQCQAIKEAGNLDAIAIASRKRPSDAHLDATLHLEHELINWTMRFSTWVGAQKGYVRALNNWLLKCLLYEPEETPDGIVPFSPGRIGAPPVFVICNQWSQALERISEKEVVDSMRVSATSVLRFWEQDWQAMRPEMKANKDLDRKVKNLDKEDQKIQKQIQALDKVIVMVSGDGNNLSLPEQIVYPTDTSHTSLQVSLQHIFEAMERFTANSMKAYDELLQRSEEDRLTREQPKVP